MTELVVLSAEQYPLSNQYLSVVTGLPVIVIVIVTIRRGKGDSSKHFPRVG